MLKKESLILRKENVGFSVKNDLWGELLRSWQKNDSIDRTKWFMRRNK